MFWVDGQKLNVDSAELVAEIDEQDRRISFSFYLECEGGESGMALNNLSVPGISAAGLTVRLAEDTRDDFNDLSQSEVTLQGNTLRVRNVFLRLGSPHDDKISVDLTAACYPFDTATEKPTGREQNVRFNGEVDFSTDSGRI